MANRAPQTNYYANPAFSQQSEFYNSTTGIQSQQHHSTIRQSPVGAQTPLHYRDVVTTNNDVEPLCDEQEFYEEMLVDDSTGIVKEKKFVVISSPINDSRNHHHQQSSSVLVRGGTNQSNCRYEYIPMQEQVSHHQHQHSYPISSTRSSPTVSPSSSKVHHRYAVIPSSIDMQNDHAMIMNRQHRYEYIEEQEEYLQQKMPSPAIKPSTRELIGKNHHQPSTRYEYIQSSTPSSESQHHIQHHQRQLQSSCYNNPTILATQKLHELLSTPRKTSNNTSILSQQQNHHQTSGRISKNVVSPPPPHQTQRRIVLTQSPPRDPFITPKKKTIHPQQPQKSRAQQKLNYALGSRQPHQDKRHTAVIAPMCSSPVQSVYSETTFTNKSESSSWMNLDVRKAPIQKTLAAAAFMMMLCGSVTSGLCFYMVSIMGRLYFLDFGTVAGFTCLVLGLLGFRTRNCYWLPNRNYISGESCEGIASSYRRRTVLYYFVIVKRFNVFFEYF